MAAASSLSVLQDSVTPAPRGESSAKIDKAAVLYMHLAGTQYTCADCLLFQPDDERCAIHGRDDVIQPFGGCGLFVQGEPALAHILPQGNVTKEESGYVESTEGGFTCGRCEHFLSAQGDCEKVDKDSDGDDPGEIQADACCNDWEQA